MIKVYTDGASKSNPGPAGSGAIAIENDKVLFEISKYLGEKTNNFAEYKAVIFALEKLIELGLTDKEIEFLSDSLLLVNQVNGNWRVKNKNIIPLFNELKSLLEKFEKKPKFVHIRREYNKKADELANQAIINK